MRVSDKVALVMLSRMLMSMVTMTMMITMNMRLKASVVALARYWVDRTKRYHRATTICFAAAVLWLICLSLDDIALNAYVIVTTFMFLGLSLGPIEPCLADLSVEVCYHSRSH
jgi:hypothetical protein